MKKLVKFLVGGAVLVLAYKIGSNVSFTLPKKTTAINLNPSVTDAEADLVIRGLHLTETTGDQLLWEIKADSARVYQQQQFAQLKNIKLVLYEEQNPVLHVKSQQGRLNMQSRDMAVEGQVVASSQDGLTFETNSLNWKNQKRLLHTSDPVKITRANVQIQGMGLVADVGLEKLKLYNGVTTIIN